ncbi:transposable element Tc1 transposase [Trichonephila clavipes]|nr:transposable element Tc1 transposase [Trichonephila clavipes]
MRPLEDVEKNGWTMADFSVMMVAVDLGPQQIGRVKFTVVPTVTPPAHCRTRLQRCLALSGCNHADWRRIVFSDEFRFQLCLDYHRRRVWRRKGQRVDTAFPIARYTVPQPGFMVWRAISFDSQIPLVVIRDTFTEQRYVDDFLRTVLLLFLLQYPSLIFSAR